MLWLVYGIPGTGKTLLGGMADSLIPAVQKGRKVFTNITGLSVAGISCVAGVPPTQVKISIVESVGEILEAFDNPDNFHSIFILDEMRQVLAGDEKLENWLSQRLNVMRKRDIDFVMIAQVPSYFSAELRELAQGCSLFKRMYSLGVKSRTAEYRFNSGTPRIVSGKPQCDGFRIRRLDPELFTCYSSYVDNQIKGNEDDNQRTSSVWKSPKAFVAYLAIAFFIGLAIFGIIMFKNIKSSVGEFGDIVSGKSHKVQSSIVDSLSVNKSSSSLTGGNENEDDKPCYSYIVCDSVICKTDIGFYPYGSYNSEYRNIVTPSAVISRCGD